MNLNLETHKALVKVLEEMLPDLDLLELSMISIQLAIAIEDGDIPGLDIEEPPGDRTVLPVMFDPSADGWYLYPNPEEGDELWLSRSQKAATASTYFGGRPSPVPETPTSPSGDPPQPVNPR